MEFIRKHYFRNWVIAQCTVSSYYPLFSSAYARKPHNYMLKLIRKIALTHTKG